MDNNKSAIEKLREIGVKEVSLKTHIDEEIVKSIINRDLKRLRNVNLKGFLKIIQREFDLDLNSWIEKGEDEKPKVDQKNSKDKNSSQNKESKEDNIKKGEVASEAKKENKNSKKKIQDLQDTKEFKEALEFQKNNYATRKIDENKDNENNSDSSEDIKENTQSVVDENLKETKENEIKQSTKEDEKPKRTFAPNYIEIGGEKKSFSLLFWFFVAFILAGIIVYFQLYKMFDFFPEVSESNKSINYSEISTVNKAEEKLKNAGVDVPKFDENKTLIKQNIEMDKNSSKNALDKSIEIEKNSTALAQEADKNSTLVEQNSTILDAKNSENKENLAEKINGAMIVSSSKMWVGSILLPSGKKISSRKKEFKIDLDKEQIILTAHGKFSLNVKGKVEEYNLKKPVRFYVKDGKISEISYDEFLKLNKGKAW